MAPCADLTPCAPPGIVTLTEVSWWKPRLGTNFSVFVPSPCHAPATCGSIFGSGEFAASGAENRILMSVIPLTPVAFLDGVSDNRCNGPTGVCDDECVLGLVLPVLAMFRWPPDDCADACVSVIQTPATSRRTITPPIAAIRPRTYVNGDNSDSLARHRCPAVTAGGDKGAPIHIRTTLVFDFRWTQESQTQVQVKKRIRFRAGATGYRLGRGAWHRPAPHRRGPGGCSPPGWRVLGAGRPVRCRRPGQGAASRSR